MAQGKIKNADIASGAAIDRAKLAAGTANGVVVNDGSGALTSVAPGSSGNVLKSDGTSWVSGPAAGGLTNFTDAVSTSAPNATVPVVSLTATNAATNVDAVFAAKGTGAVLAQTPDGTTTGGNKRGSYAVDLQMQRAFADRVASGYAATVGGGQSNKASGDNAGVASGSQNQATASCDAVAGGFSNTASGGSSFVGSGDTNTASALYAGVLSGKTNTASGQYAGVSGGLSNTASGTAAACGGGSTNTVSGSFATVPGGANASTRGLTGRFSFASGRFSTNGDAQAGMHVTRASTVDATPAILTSTATTASATNVNVLPNAATYLIEAHIVARNTTTGDSASWILRARANRGASAAATTVGTVQTDFSDADAGASGWAATLIADTTLGAIEVRATGAAATTIHWVATMHTTEVQ